MKIISTLKTLPLLSLLIGGLSLTPALASAGEHNERHHGSAQTQQDNHNHGRSGGHRADHDGVAHGRNHRGQHPHNRGHHYHPGRHAMHRHHHGRHYHTHRPVRHPHHHRHARVHNYYQRHAYVTANPGLILGLHNDNVSIFYRNH